MSRTTRGGVVLAVFTTAVSFLPVLSPRALAQGGQETAGQQSGKGSAAQDGQGRSSAPQIPADKGVQTHELGFTYSILEPGVPGKSPSIGDEAVIHFSEWLSDGTLIQSTRKEGKPLHVSVGDTRFPMALSLGPKLVGKGGRVKLTMPPDKAYGKDGKAGFIPPNSTMVYEVELVDYVYRPKPAQFVQGDPKKTVARKSGLKYQILAEGKGDAPGVNDIVELEFTIWNLQGQMLFGTFRTGRTLRAPIKQLSHPFLQEIVPEMRDGADWRVIVPTNLTVKELEIETIWDLKLLGHEKPPVLPPSNEQASTTTKSALLFERLEAGKGDRPRDQFVCVFEWDFWQEDGTYVAGGRVGGGPMTIIVGKAPHKFLDEIVQLMQVGEVMRIEVPQDMTGPQLLVFKSIWRLKLLEIREPMQAPKFALPKDDELTATKSGLRYKVLERGDGKGRLPRMGEAVTVHYAGWLVDGKAFDSSYSRGEPASFELGQVIPGWNEGLQLMKPGDTFLFVIPPALAYGARGTPDGAIPPESTLVFHVKLLDAGK